MEITLLKVGNFFTFEKLFLMVDFSIRNCTCQLVALIFHSINYNLNIFKQGCNKCNGDRTDEICASETWFKMNDSKNHFHQNRYD